MKIGWISFGTVIALAALACGNDDNATYSPPPIPNYGGDGGAGAPDATSPASDATFPSADGSSDGSSDASDAGTPTDASGSADGALSQCFTTFSFVPPAGTSVTTLSVTGEWNDWADPGVPMTGPDVNGAYSARVALPVGMVGYKLILNGNWEMDPGAWLRKFVGGEGGAIENSAVLVADCHVPTFSVVDSTPARPSAEPERTSRT